MAGREVAGCRGVYHFIVYDIGPGTLCGHRGGTWHNRKQNTVKVRIIGKTLILTLTELELELYDCARSDSYFEGFLFPDKAVN